MQDIRSWYNERLWNRHQHYSKPFGCTSLKCLKGKLAPVLFTQCFLFITSITIGILQILKMRLNVWKCTAYWNTAIFFVLLQSSFFIFYSLCCQLRCDSTRDTNNSHLGWHPLLQYNSWNLAGPLTAKLIPTFFFAKSNKKFSSKLNRHKIVNFIFNSFIFT